MQWQHGVYELQNGKLILNPFSVDGRQLLYSPCGSQPTTYTRYNQTETFSQWSLQMDTYSGRFMLQLYKFDGTPANPMYLAYRPPMMLPTEILNPIKIISEKRRKRDLVWHAALDVAGQGGRMPTWLGIVFTVCGSVLLFLF